MKIGLQRGGGAVQLVAIIGEIQWRPVISKGSLLWCAAEEDQQFNTNKYI